MVGSAIEYMSHLEEAANKNIPSLNGYFNKQHFQILDDAPKVDQEFNIAQEICPRCGICYTPHLMNLKLKKKKQIKNKRNMKKVLVITCQNCKMSTSRDSQFKINITKPVPKKDKINESSLPGNNNKGSQEINTTPASKARLNSLLSKSDVKTPCSSPFITPESVGSKTKRKRGKSFSPLVSQDEKTAKKSSSGKPSLLSFLTSL